MMKSFTRILLIICVLFLFVMKASAQVDTVRRQAFNALSIDIIPLYYDLFDTKKQIRVGLEYERRVGKNWMLSLLVDAGLFNDYYYFHYYDFFNQGPAYHYTRMHTKIEGFHLIPSANYFVYQSKSHVNRGIYAGMMLDFHYYKKKLSLFHSLDEIITDDEYWQTSLSTGPRVGCVFGFGQHFFLEASFNVPISIYTKVSKRDVLKIKPLNAQWSDSQNSISLLSQLKVAYAF